MYTNWFSLDPESFIQAHMFSSLQSHRISQKLALGSCILRLVFVFSEHEIHLYLYLLVLLALEFIFGDSKRITDAKKRCNIRLLPTVINQLQLDLTSFLDKESIFNNVN